MLKNRLSTIVAGLALAAITTAASASTVSFSTKGGFNANVPATTDTYSFGAGGLLSFTSVSSTVNAPDDNPFSLGVITVSSSSNTVSNIPANTSFTLLVSQTFPSAANGSFTSAITGTIVKTNLPGNAVKITWANPTSLSLGGVSYVLLDTVIDLGYNTNPSTGSAAPGNPVSYSSPIYANIGSTAVPLPTSAASGLGLLGLAAFRRIRSRA